jgi:UDP-GlcNAc3NAcA epimerase
MYDIFLEQRSQLPENPAYNNGLKKGSPYLLVTLHRAGNTDDYSVFSNVLEGLMKVADKMEMPLYLPLHPRTKHVIENFSNEKTVQRFTSHPRIILAEPASYPEFLKLLQDCKMVLTDAGGVQKEAYFSAKPCVILREETEWVELTDAGFAALGGIQPESILIASQRMLTVNISEQSFIYGDGKASEAICREIEYHFGK